MTLIITQLEVVASLLFWEYRSYIYIIKFPRGANYGGGELTYFVQIVGGVIDLVVEGVFNKYRGGWGKIDRSRGRIAGELIDLGEGGEH